MAFTQSLPFSSHPPILSFFFLFSFFSPSWPFSRPF
ncbi:hypothetical protein CCACVL1_11049 [Corchorus capsularis]|uniref:Uncharacterized protein n=1 Tax=Corchorus capsularis TaxID=210143 RepID=A0A1R3IN74_COCAP|nr:hypothetical protein CCACVL1_11049 [Corchorus capsularis]